MGKAGAFSALAETAEEYIKVECARRRNQVSLKRRPSLRAQFRVSGHKSRLKEKLGQARRQAFLLRADNKASLIALVDNVRELATEANTKSSRTGLSPLESDRFLGWASDVEKLLFEFEPSENHDDDPLLKILEHLQFLQDGHMCLAEAAMDARVLLERWDRAGIFDSDSSSGEDEDDNDQTHSRNAFLALDPVKEKRRRLENSYAYQNVRQRAAASLIKRNVLNWVRSKPSFCERVAEIEAFGRTTEGLLKELSLTSAALAGDKASGNTDIFAITTGRYDPKSRYNGSIAFKDLLQFSKHMALFPIDQALRTVEDVTRRRYLFDTRCAMKIQFVWRRVREIVRARRIRRAVEELRSQREREAQAKRDATKEAKKRKPSEMKKKPAKVALKRSGTGRPPIAKPSTATPTIKEPQTPAIEQEKQLSPPTPPEGKNLRVNTRGSVMLNQDEKPKSPVSTPRHRQRQSRVSTANESDDDITDVEAAWKSFMDAVVVDGAIQEVIKELEVVPTPEDEPAPPITPPQTVNNWESWSDEETEIENNEDQDPDDEIDQCPPTPAAAHRIKVVVAIASRSNTPDKTAVGRRKLVRKSVLEKQNQVRPPTTPSTPGGRPLSSLPFDATLQNHTGPYTGAGHLSLMAPFIDADRMKNFKPSVVQERKHLYDLDFTSVKREDASIVHLASMFVHSGETEAPDALTQQKTPEKQPSVRTNSRLATVARLRHVTAETEQNVRANNPADNSPITYQQNKSDDSGRVPSPERDIPARQTESKSSYVVYNAHGVNFKREVVMRKGTMNYSPVTGPPDENSVVLTSPGKGEMKVWRRSTVAATQGLTAPHPPVNRRGTPRKKRPQGSGRTVLDSDPVDVQATPVRASTKQADARSELPLLLRRSRAAARRREKERIEIPEDELQDEVDDCDQNSNKQMWKRGGELPALALAQIRDRVGYKPKPFNQRRRSVVVEIPPAAPDTGSEEGESADDHPETIEEESDEDDETNSDEDSTSDHEGTGAEDDDDESSAADGDIGRDDPPRSSIRQRRESTELSKEFRRLHLASQERELSLQNSLLSQLHSEKSADPRRQSKQRRSSVHRRQSRRPSAQAQSEQSAISSDAVIPSYDPVLHDSSDEDWEPVRRRRVRVKTRDAAADANADLSGEEDNDDNDNRSFLDVKAIMTPAERDAAFQKLLTQYLGLLQCSPAEVARRLNVN